MGRTIMAGFLFLPPCIGFADSAETTGTVCECKPAKELVAPSARTITVSGEALVRVPPDRITLAFGLQETGTAVPALVQKMAAKGQTLVEAIKKAGAKEQHIQVDTLDLTIDYNDSGRPTSGVRGYVATRNYVVTLTTTTLTEAVMIAALTDGGAVTMSGPDLTVQNLRPLRDQARQLALKAAREKAELLAKGIGRTVGSAISVNEGWNNSFIGGSAARYSRGGYAHLQNTVQNSGQDPASGGDEGLPLGQVGVSASVSVTYQLQ